MLVMLPLQAVNAFADWMEQEYGAEGNSEDGNPGHAAGVLSMGAPSGADKPHAEQSGKVCRVA